MINSALKSGLHSYDYANLLHNYGLWARYFGAVGYLHPGLSTETYIIDDESALIVDRAMQSLKDTRPNVYRLITLFYIRGLDEYDILSVIKGPKKQKKHREFKLNYFEFNPSVDCAIHYATAETIRDLLNLGESYIFRYLETFDEKL